MSMVQQHCCEKCQRSQLHIERYSMRGYVAYLCPTCAYVLVNEEQPKHFIDLCNRVADKQTNVEMKKLHALLSQFILAGLFFVTIIAAATVVQINGEDYTMAKDEYLSFASLKTMK